MASAKGSASTTAMALLAKPAAFEDMLSKLAARDKQNVERHLALADGEPDAEHGKLYRRLARALFTLSPHAVTTVGQQALQFFVADGKYKMQTFAIEDPRDGRLLVYTGDVLKEAVKSGVLTPPAKTDASAGHVLGNDRDQRLLVESLDSNNTPNPHPWYKNMLGWGRKALRITLPVKATREQINATEALCAMYAKTLVKKEA